MTEVMEEKTDERGVKRKVPVTKYQHDAEMEEASLLRSVKKTAGEGTILMVKFRTGDVSLREGRRRHRMVDDEDDEFKCDCGFECEDRVHVVAECPWYNEREVYVTELGKIDGTYREMFEAWNREERTVAVVGHRRWVCLSRDTHNWGADRLNDMRAKWEPTPDHMILMDVKKLTGEVSTIDEVDMSDGASDDEDMKDDIGDADSSGAAAEPAAAAAAAAAIASNTKPEKETVSSPGDEGVNGGSGGTVATASGGGDGGGGDSLKDRGWVASVSCTTTTKGSSEKLAATARRWDEDSDSDSDGDGTGGGAFSEFFSDGPPQKASIQKKSGVSGATSNRAGGNSGGGGGGGVSGSGIGKRSFGKARGGAVKRRKKTEHSSPQHALSVGARTLKGGGGWGFWRLRSVLPGGARFRVLQASGVQCGHALDAVRLAGC
ncbi:unnamed protein product [Ectocarpus sp. CCAP 1310/34]|nr:unnamed protein product [Ectocarpus sp. CCAP 1310/34]